MIGILKNQKLVDYLYVQSTCKIKKYDSLMFYLEMDCKMIPKCCIHHFCVSNSNSLFLVDNGNHKFMIHYPICLEML